MLIFTAALMIGVQVPNFVDQYVKRMEAHLNEARIQYNEYQKIARLVPGRSIEDLIEKHTTSDDSTFRAEAEPLKKTLQRKEFFEKEMIALQGSFWTQGIHILTSVDKEILSDTYKSYTANLPLNTNAAICGLIFGLLASLIMEFFWGLLASLFRPRKKKKRITTVEVKRNEPYIKS
jgi:hypothetical protein